LLVEGKKTSYEPPSGEHYLRRTLKRGEERFPVVRDFRNHLRFVISFLVYPVVIFMVLNSASIIGPWAFGGLAFRAAQVLERFGLDPVAAAQGGYRVGLGLIVVFLLIGLLVLFSVNAAQARRAALQPVSADGKA